MTCLPMQSPEGIFRRIRREIREMARVTIQGQKNAAKLFSNPQCIC